MSSKYSAKSSKSRIIAKAKKGKKREKPFSPPKKKYSYIIQMSQKPHKDTQRLNIYYHINVV